MQFFVIMDSYRKQIGGILMNIVFLHLSDLHLQDKSGAHSSRIQALARSLNEFSPFDGIVIIFSGDIASKGNENEYSNASSFIGRLVTEIESLYSTEKKNIKILIVPGNHDICYTTGHRPKSEDVRKAYNTQRDTYLNSELGNMTPFLTFANNNCCFFKGTSVPYGQLYTRKILHFSEGYMIEANLLNTAPFSCDSDDGLHYVPDEAIALLGNPSHANMAITVMHHSLDWFSFEQRKDLQSTISHRSSIVFYGHEHISASQQVISEGADRTVYQAGGAWWQSSVPSMCEYYASQYDTITNKYSILKFTWNSNHFASSSAGDYTLLHKPLNGLSLPCKEEYLSQIRSDSKHTISSNIADYFVFLKLRIRNPKRIMNERTIESLESLLSYILDKRYVAIVGGTNSGKTTLLKILFCALYLDHTVLYCGTDDITGRNSEKIIKELVETTYGENSYSAFRAIPRSSKIILIDDLHRIKPKHINKFLNEIKQHFGIIVVATDDTEQLDVIQTLKDSIQTEEDFNQLFLTKLYAAKRFELISKIVNIKASRNLVSSVSKDVLIRTLEQCLNTYKMAFNTDIDFVVQFVDYFCTHFSELDSLDRTVFSKVFEASIECAISSNLQRRKETANDIIVALSEVAHYLHFHMEYPISAQHIKETIESYCEYYDNKYLTPARFIEIVVDSGLLIVSESGDSYRFKSKDHLAYFVAKALNRKFHDDGDAKDLRQIVDQSCFGINGDILLFLTYMGDNVAIARLLLNQECELVKDWPEFDVTNITAKYLTTIQTAELISPPDDQREQDLESRSSIEEEATEKLDDTIQTIDLYDYDISRVDDFGNQIIRAYFGLRTIARSFSTFISILPAKDKKSIVDAIFKLPNLIFGKLSEEIDKEAKELIDYLYEQQEQLEYENRKLSKSDLLLSLQAISTQVLLNMYFTVAQHGVSTATVDYLVSQDIVDNSTTYQLERLLFYDKVDDWQALIVSAEKLYEKNDIGILRNICKLCLRHMLVYSSGLTKQERLRVTNKYFSSTKTELLVSRQKTLPPKEV